MLHFILNILSLLLSVVSLHAMNINSDIFNRLSIEVSKSRSMSKVGDESCFKNTQLGLDVYEYALKEYFPQENIDKKAVVDSLWTTCSYTAPLALSYLSPLKSYHDRIEAIKKVSNWNNPHILNWNDIHIRKGLELLKLSFKKTYNEPNNIVIYLCNLYAQNHVFLIYKVGELCLVLQSYISAYTFDEFLKDSNKHTVWKAQDLLQELAIMSSTAIPITERMQSYQKLFFAKMPSPILHFFYAQEVPFIFIETMSFNIEDGRT